MTLQTIITLSGLGIGSLLLVVANWSTLKNWMPRVSRSSSSSHNTSSPTALIDAYHVARDACEDDADLAARTNQVFKDLICQKVLRCEK